MSDEFNLQALIREVCDNSTITAPEAIAEEVGRRISKADQREALDQALVIAVRVVVSRSRGSLFSPDGPPPNDTQGRLAVGAPNRSRKVAGIRETWRRVLRERVNVGPREWKFMADCTADDLEYSASVNDEHARSNAAKAEQKRTLARLLDEYNVKTVGKLPPEALNGALGVAA